MPVKRSDGCSGVESKENHFKLGVRYEDFELCSVAEMAEDAEILLFRAQRIPLV